MRALSEEWVFGQLTFIHLCDFTQSLNIWGQNEFAVSSDCAHSVGLVRFHEHNLICVAYDVFTRNMPNEQTGVRKANLKIGAEPLRSLANAACRTMYLFNPRYRKVRKGFAQ